MITSFLLTHFSSFFKNSATKDNEDNCSNAPCINIIQVAEQSPRHSQQKSGKSAYFLARAKAKSYNIGHDDEKSNHKKEGKLK